MEKHSPLKYVTDAGKERFNACEALKPYYEFMNGTYLFTAEEYARNAETVNQFLGFNVDWKLETLGNKSGARFVLYDTNDF